MALRAFAALAALGLLLAPRVARADCPDGWFCERGPEPPPATGTPNAPASAPSPQQREPPPALPPSPMAEEAFVVVPPPPPARHHHHSRAELGVNFHLDVGVTGSGAADNAWLGGAGFAFRLRPLPALAVELGLEIVGGNDYNGNDRAEQTLRADVLGFVNPRDPLQFFVLGGFHLGGASVRLRHQGGQPTPPIDESYTYVGAQAGVGLEWRFARRAALTTDFQLFIRGRTDVGRDEDPEYVDPKTHLTTNESGGGLWRLGATFYF